MIAVVTAQWTVRIAGSASLLLGILHWIGGPSSIVPFHMLVGVILVVELWVLAALGLRAGTGPALPAVTIAWGIVTVWFGLNQATILSGDASFVVQVAHLMTGLVAMGIGEVISARIHRISLTP